MSSTNNPGRVAGILYLLLVVCAPIRLIYIPSTLFASGNATATANNIAAHELLFRLGIAADLLGEGVLTRWLLVKQVNVERWLVKATAAEMGA